MSPIDDILRARREKLKRLSDFKIDPYPEKARRSIMIGEALEKFPNLSKKKIKIAIAGRIAGLRLHGKILFADLRDESGKIQLLFKKEDLGPKSKILANIDLGDFLWLEGTLFKTKAGEKTLEAKDFGILAKALRPIPSEWYGLSDMEERFRRRHLDLLVNEEVTRRFRLRSKITALIREFLHSRGFIEVETPILQPLYGGAAAHPFKTHHRFLDQDFYLRIAPELYLKRLIVAGFEKIYELGRVFRNEGIDREHNPEFTMLELYWAYQDRAGLMKFCEELVSFLVIALKRELKMEGANLVWQGKKISLKRPWKIKEFSALLKKATGFEYDNASVEALRRAGEAKGLEFDKNLPKGKIADEIFKKLILPELIQPTFVINHPVDISPLAKRNPKNPNQALRFQAVMAGWEFINGFAELNDPLDQRGRFQVQEEMRKTGDQEAMRYDEDYVEALEYGMPPTAGLGLGIDRLAALLTDAPSLKEVILFPLMKSKS